MIRVLILLVLVLPCTAQAGQKADAVLVEKSEARLSLVKEGRIFKEFSVALGPNPEGHKQRLGDGRTPEGKYILDYKKEDSDFYKAIHISYPDRGDLERARAGGEDPGSQIMIHGQPNGCTVSQRLNWTDGCIAVTNSAMDEIWEAVDAGTPIVIVP
ncbi:MAG: L,D-transpeptidase family protein [Desulfobacteraceae bacterium]|nr:L,D-transpeptidase family protein [Desulfobacteraceae bacterium]